MDDVPQCFDQALFRYVPKLQPRRAFDRQVIWKENDAYDRAGQERIKNFPKVEEHIRSIASAHGRTNLMDRLVSGDELHTRKLPISTKISRLVTKSEELASIIHTAMGRYLTEQFSLIIRQEETDESRILVQRAVRKRSGVSQLVSVQRAVNNGNRYKIEKAYHELSRHAEMLLVTAWKHARTSEWLRIHGPSDVRVSELLGRLILRDEALKPALPIAILAAKRRGSLPYFGRHDLLVKIINAYFEASGLLPAGTAEKQPRGADVDFVRFLEGLYGVRLLPSKSSEALQAARNEVKKWGV